MSKSQSKDPQGRDEKVASTSGLEVDNESALSPVTVTSPPKVMDEGLEKGKVPEELLKTDISECLQSLGFVNMSSRENEVLDAIPHTCDWLFTTQGYQDCLSKGGFFWIRGSSGVGKSTLMKHAAKECRDTPQGCIVSSFFFNAGGEYLEQNPIGMLRSLLHQTLKQDKQLLAKFVPLFLQKQDLFGNNWEWEKELLTDFVITEVARHCSKPLILIIDALDECESSDVQGTLDFLETFRKEASQSGIRLSICLSSRDDPPTTLKELATICLDDSPGHQEDLKAHCVDMLGIGGRDLIPKLLTKANSNFLWLDIALRILVSESNSMPTKLDTLPPDLGGLISLDLQTHNGHIQETVLLFQWMLFNCSSLTPEELYCAVKAGTSQELSPATPEVIRAFITDRGCDLVEIRENDLFENVHFVHESIREVLLDGLLGELDEYLKEGLAAQSHARLAQCCLAYLSIPGIPTSVWDLKSPDTIIQYPFLDYATTFLLKHAEDAQVGLQDQSELLRSLAARKSVIRLKVAFWESISKHSTRVPGLDRPPELLYLLAYEGCVALTATALLKRWVQPNAIVGFHGTALQAAMLSPLIPETARLQMVILLLRYGANVNAPNAFGKTPLNLCFTSKFNWLERTFKQSESQLSNTIRLSILNLLLKNDKSRDAANENSQRLVRALLGSGWDPNLNTRYELVRMLLDCGADANVRHPVYGTTLHLVLFLEDISPAARLELLQLLIEHKADVNALGQHNLTPLETALSIEADWFDGREDVIRLLVKAGADLSELDREDKDEVEGIING